jgi:hypothetical protein
VSEPDCDVSVPIVSDATVKTHVSNILAKLRLRDRIHAVIYAYETRARPSREQPAGASRVIGLTRRAAQS